PEARPERLRAFIGAAPLLQWLFTAVGRASRSRRRADRPGEGGGACGRVCRVVRGRGAAPPPELLDAGIAVLADVDLPLAVDRDTPRLGQPAIARAEAAPLRQVAPLA